MKKIIFFCFIGMLFASCSSVRTFTINRMRHQEPSLSTISINDCEVLGQVEGSSDLVSSVFIAERNMFQGDTGLYGSLDWDDAIYLDLPIKSDGISPATPFDAALANAVYQMIEEADKLKADAILFVRTKTQVKQKGEHQEVVVSVRGTAVKLKTEKVESIAEDQ